MLVHHPLPTITCLFHKNGHPQARVYNRRFEYKASSGESGPCVSYFDRLPLELKVEIFTQCLAAYPRLSAKEAPLVLCCVSSSWRAIAQYTARLWARFEVNVPDSGAIGSTHNQNRMNALNLWLDRSRNNALSVRITHNFVGRISDSCSERLLVALIPHAHRWKDVQFHIPSSSIGPLQDLALGALPMLRSVALDMKRLWHSHVPFDIHALGIPWGQLTGLSLQFDFDHLLTLDKCLHILSQCANLANCTINADCTFNTQRELSQKLALPMLRHFDLILQWGEQVHENAIRITDTAESCLISFLEQLDLPQLQSLSLQWLVKLEGGERHWSEVHSRFLSILGAVAPTLRSLALAYLPLADKEMVDCLVQLHDLSYLDLRFSLADKEHDPITDALLHTCTLRPDEFYPSFLPLLESVYLQCHGARYTAIQAADLVESRWRHAHGGAHLKSFSLISMKPISALTRKRLKEWSEEGLDVLMDQVIFR